MSFVVFLGLLFGYLAVILPTHNLRCHEKTCSNGNCPEEGEKDCEGGDFSRCRKISYVVGTDPSSTFQGMDCANSVMDCNSEIVCESVKRKLKQRRITVSNCRVFCCDGDLCNGPDLRAPDLSQDFKTLSAGEDGDDGKHGVNGPIVEIFAEKIEGYVNIQTSGGNGKQGQNGADGIDGTDSEDEKLPISNMECWERARRDRRGQVIGCIPQIPGLPGEPGGDGTDGGYARKSGNGGDAGHQSVHVRKARGKMELITCRRTGGRAAINGLGGVGGEGGLAGHGIKCYYRGSCFPRMCPPTCASHGYLEEDNDLALGPYIRASFF